MAWQGYYGYGPQYGEHVVEAVRRAAEHCDCLQSFMMLHSMGGGTGSGACIQCAHIMCSSTSLYRHSIGLGSHILELLADHFPETYRFVTPVCPSQDDDVITSPYNAVLALDQLTNFADCVLPVRGACIFRLHVKWRSDSLFPG